MRGRDGCDYMYQNSHTSCSASTVELNTDTAGVWQSRACEGSCSNRKFFPESITVPSLLSPPPLHSRPRSRVKQTSDCWLVPQKQNVPKICESVFTAQKMSTLQRSLCLSVYMSVFVYLCFYLSLSLSLPVFLCLSVSVCLPACLSACLPACLPACLSVCLSLPPPPPSFSSI